MRTLTQSYTGQTDSTDNLQRALHAIMHANSIISAREEAIDPSFITLAASEILEEAATLAGAFPCPEAEVIQAVLPRIIEGTIASTDFRLTLQEPEFQKTPFGTLPDKQTVCFSFPGVNGDKEMRVAFSVKRVSAFSEHHYEIDRDGEVSYPYSTLGTPSTATLDFFTTLLNRIVFSCLSFPLTVTDDELVEAQNTLSKYRTLLDAADKLKG